MSVPAMTIPPGAFSQPLKVIPIPPSPTHGFRLDPESGTLRVNGDVVIGFDGAGCVSRGDPPPEGALVELAKSSTNPRDKLLVLLACEVVSLRAEVERLRSRL